MFNEFPYTDLHNLNLDWFLEQFKHVIAEFKKLKADISEIVQSGDSVPVNVRQAIFNILNNNAFADDSTYNDDLAIIRSWAESNVTSITLNYNTLTFNGPGSQTVIATTTPADGHVSWLSSNESVATVNEGVVTSVGNGSCIITATSGSKSANCNVTVTGFATLTGINAVYTQSGTVYDTDTLDSLRNDLIVTALYDNSTTQTVTDYTLSGSLTEGTSIITVSYAGKTTTFNVIVSSLVRTYELEGNDKGFNEAAAIGTPFEDTKKTTTARFRTPNPVPVSNGDILSLSWNADADPSDMQMYLLYYDENQNYAGHRSLWTNNPWTYNVDYPYLGLSVKSRSDQYITDAGRTITLTVSSGT